MSNLLACSFYSFNSQSSNQAESDIKLEESMILIFNLDNQLYGAAKNSSGKSKEFNCMTNFDFLGIYIPTISLSFFWGPRGESSEPLEEINHDQADSHVGSISNVGRHPHCYFSLSNTDEAEATNNISTLIVVDPDNAVYFEYDVLDSGRCFRKKKHDIVFGTLPIRVIDQPVGTSDIANNENPEYQMINYKAVIPNYDDAPRDIELASDVLVSRNEAEFSSECTNLENTLENFEDGKSNKDISNQIQEFETAVDKQGEELVDHSINSYALRKCGGKDIQYNYYDAMDCNNNIVVMDCGSGNCKVGFAGQSAPIISFPSIIGRPKYADVMDETFTHSENLLRANGSEGDVSLRDFYVGSEAQSMRGVLYLQHPVEHGV